MKNHTIKTPTAELMIVEVPNSWGLTIGEEALLIYDHTKKTFGKTHTFNGHYTLLGKPDEISEEDAMELVEKEERIGKSYYMNYKDGYTYPFGALKSLLSLLESEIYWINPWGVNGAHLDSYKHLWKEAQEKTFDRNRSVIFVKN